jgi:predicted transcriptional regulator
MAVNKVKVELDEELVQRARDRAAAPDATDSEVIAEAVAESLGFAAMREAQNAGGLPQDEADALAVEEVRAHRADRRGDA